LPIDRDRRRAKRRYTRRQAAAAARAATRRRRQRILVAVIAVVALAAGIYGITRMSGAVEGADAGSQGVASHGNPRVITYGDSRWSPDGGGRTVVGSVTKGLDILTDIPQGGSANDTSGPAPDRPISFESSTVTPR
jgi:hypothetical protein